MKKFSLVLGLVLAVVAASVAAAQEVVVVQGPIRPAQAITELGDYGLALGHFFEGLGNFARSYSEAMVRLQQANALHIENEGRRIVAFWTTRDAWFARLRNHYRNRRPTMDELRERAIPAGVCMKIFAADGKIDWPHVLRDERFAPHRKSLEDLLCDGNAKEVRLLPAGDRRLIREASKAWLGELKSQISVYHGMDYNSGKQFLIALGNQAARPNQATDGQ